MNQKEIAHRFVYHPADHITGTKHEQVRFVCGVAAEELIKVCPEGRELAITKLEEAMFWGNAAIARSS